MTKVRDNARVLVGPAALAGVGVAAIILATQTRKGSIHDTFGPIGVPIFVGAVLLTLAGLIAATDLSSNSLTLVSTDRRVSGWRTVTLAGAGFSWVLLLGLLGYLVTSTVALSIILLGAGVRLRQAVIAAITGALLTDLVFVQTLGIRVPAGPLDIMLANFIDWGVHP